MSDVSQTLAVDAMTVELKMNKAAPGTASIRFNNVHRTVMVYLQLSSTHGSNNRKHVGVLYG